MDILRRTPFRQSVCMNRIKELRAERGWSMEVLAEAVGTTASQISKLEKGKRRLTDIWMGRLAEAFGVNAAEILMAPANDMHTSLQDAPASLAQNGARMGAIGSRIKEVRTSRGLTQEEFARFLGNRVTRGAVGNWERDKGIKRENMELISNQANVPFEWLARGVGPTPDDEDSHLTQIADDDSPQSGATMTDLIELDVRASAGPGLTVEEETIVAYWKMPRSLIEAHTQTHPSGLRILTVYGDSMEPNYHPGSRVMVDPLDISPSPPGVFVVWDGLGLVIKRVEVVPHTDPVRVRLMSDNEQYTPYEVTMDEAYIQGRVIGGWKWT